MRRLVLPALLCALTVTASAVPRARRAAPRPVLAAVSDPAAFTPPNEPRALENAFWQAIWKLERRQTGSPDAEPLADSVRAEMGRLRPEEAQAVMRLFLAAAYHYEGAEEGTLSQELRQRHEERFSDRVRDFARLTRRLADGGGPAAAEALFARVRALAGPGAAGLELSKRLSDADPKNAHALTRLAWDLSDTGDLKGAVEASERAIGLSSAASSAYTVLASAKYQLRDLAGANAAANQALALDPGDKMAYGIVTLTQDRLPAAMMALDGMAAMELEDAGRRDAVATPPAPGAAALSRGLADSARAALRQKDYVRAESLATEALAADPDNVNALSRRALARMRRERLDDALADSSRALELMGNAPNHVHLTIHAQILNRLSRSAEALPLAERALSLNPPTDRSRAQALFQKAWALAGTGERKSSLKTLAQAARLYRRYVPFYQEAAAQPEDTDLTLIFASDWLAADPAPAAAPAADAGGSLLSGQRPLIILAFSVLGGLLIATGLLRAAQAKSAAPTTVPGTPVPSVDGLLAGTYRMGARIGSGGMGIVFEAFDVNLERRVAIKKMRDEICADPRERERFLREARTVAALKHPNIVEIHAVVGDGRDVYLVFEHVDGHTVTEYLQSYRRIPFDQAVRVTQGAAAALDYAHARGVVHRDLKPSNIMITREGVVKVMDFGVARQAKDTLGAIGSTETVAGTPQYMSPEQEQGSVRAESDVFALGVCLYEMVTGSLPFQGVGVTMSINKTKRAYVPASKAIAGLPPGTDQVIDWALDPDPDKRCKTPLRFAQAAEALLRPRVGLKPPDQLQQS